MTLREATLADIHSVWEILQQAIERRRQDGSNQWQDGYPNKEVVRSDIANGSAYVLTTGGKVVAYAAIIFGIEPAYDNIDGEWLTDGAYVVVHRVAVSNAVVGQGVATHLFGMVEQLSVRKGVYSVKVDTNFDNAPMLKILSNLGYIYCGEVVYESGLRLAYEKVLT